MATTTLTRKKYIDCTGQDKARSVAPAKVQANEVRVSAEEERHEGGKVSARIRTQFGQTWSLLLSLGQLYMFWRQPAWADGAAMAGG